MVNAKSFDFLTKRWLFCVRKIIPDHPAAVAPRQSKGGSEKQAVLFEDDDLNSQPRGEESSFSSIFLAFVCANHAHVFLHSFCIAFADPNPGPGAYQLLPSPEKVSTNLSRESTFTRH